MNIFHDFILFLNLFRVLIRTLKSEDNAVLSL